MESQNHSLEQLFKQLGLDSSEASIAEFISKNAPIASDVKLHQAAFWSPSQSSFLQQSKADDADWSEIVDQLDTMLR